MEYNYDFYQLLLRKILYHDYAFCRFNDTRSSVKKSCYLRHDVDISPYSALTLGEIETDLGVNANYFFQIGAETYNIFSPRIIAIIEQLRRLGHCVGLHIDATTYHDENMILLTYDWFNRVITPIDKVVSFHQPSQEILSKNLCNGIISTYSSEFFSTDIYLSDSRRNTEFYTKLEKWLADKRPLIQILLHPEWWYPEMDIEKYTNILINRRSLELKEYLKNNLTSYFGAVIDDEYYCYRL